MSNEVLGSALPSSMRFDDLGVLEITDPALLSVVAAGVNSPYLNRFCDTNGQCTGNGTCLGNEYCSNDSYCVQ